MLDESVLGAFTPDPLRFAFEKKHSAHAGAHAQPPLSQEQLSEQLKKVLSDAQGVAGKKKMPLCSCSFLPSALYVLQFLSECGKSETSR